MMENSTLKTLCIKELNENFYFISFDAETKESLSIIISSASNHGNQYGIHELAQH
jgi:hypothetical protein